ncbi:hypothetical protein LOTGIDRAFT_172818 [Lottia gigantea]|uniref:Potassium channel tetramerisation-type BTB domain-containing protein n=1 Tax=Lottia gigantea TaxID=225164 RepID=V4B529_LOTGI|nr:hypothetical protein LOTGIDRAFT_172818 [Lottia gigantea]ESP01082.1 hypothetical protein LOTGIDRAFT_172818 [Lottia gigantea]
MDTETFAGADVLSLDAPSDDSLFDEDDRPTLDTEPETIPQVEIKDSEPEMIAQVEITDSEPETIPQVEITDSEPETMAQVETVVEPEESETQSSVQVEQVESVKEKIAQVEPVSGGYVEPVQSIEYNPTSIVKKLQKIQVCQESPVHVMVGGTKFVTSIPTITAEPSLLSAMVDKDSIVRPQMIDNIPTYSLDRNPEEFSVILDYLRNKGNVPARYELPVTTNQLENQLLEATFYELEGLKALIVDKLH